MPLGASVTFGVGSTTGNSYRKDLRDLLVESGATVNIVGTQKNGNFVDNDCEAFSGFVIEQIAAKAKDSVPKLLPNVVLVDAGTNNCNSGIAVQDAGYNVSKMIDRIYADSPGVTVLLATLLTNKIPSQEECRLDVNRQYMDVALSYQSRNAKLILVDMRGSNGLTTADLNDTRHPNDGGYSKMANIWFQGIAEAQAKMHLELATDNGIPTDGNSQNTIGDRPNPPDSNSNVPQSSTAPTTPTSNLRCGLSAMLFSSLMLVNLT
jgi:lysophospholipase L1-like esterase